MLNSLDVSNFRSIKSLDLPELAKINLIVGPNSSGKTSLLQSLFMFCLDGDADKLAVLAPPETDETNLEAIEAATRWLFHANEGHFKERIVIAGKVSGVDRTVTFSQFADAEGDIRESQYAKGLRHPSRAGSLMSESEIVPDLDEIRATSRAIFELRTNHGNQEFLGKLYLSTAGPMVESRRPPNPFISATYTRSLVKPVAALAKLYDSIQQEHDRIRLLELLQTVDARVEQVRIGVAADSTPVIRIVHKDLGVVPIALLGDGFVSAFHFAMLTCRSKVDCVFFDEFDASLHVDTLCQMAKFFRLQADKGVQMFFTTHRYDTVEAFVNLASDGWDGLSVIQVSKSSSGTHAKYFSGDKLLKAWRDFGLDLRVPS